MINRPLAIDLYAGLGGWTEGFLAEGWDVVGFDIVRHEYGWKDCPECQGTGNFYRHDEDGDYLPCDCVEQYRTAFTEHEGKVPNRYPAQLVLQDVLTLHGSQFRRADCIVASPPCQEFSYMAMPWSRARQIAAALREEAPFPEEYTGSRTVAQLTALFSACFRIQREACESAGRHIPMVVENVKGAQSWVGKARANFGSFYFWGDVAMVGGRVVAGIPQFGQTVKAARRGGIKVGGFSFHQFEKTGQPGGSFQSAAVKVGGIKLSDVGFNVAAAQRYREEQGTKQNGSGPEWFDNGIAKHSSRSDSRKAASAQIAKIPFPLSSYIARCLKPTELRETRPSPARVPDPARA